MSAHLAQPDGENAGGPFIPVEYQARFIVNLYRIKPHFSGQAGTFVYRRAVLSRVKGLGKSPLLAAVCAAELLGPTVFDGFDADGRAVGRQRPSALVQIAACSEDQTANTFPLVAEMLKLGAAADEYALDIGLTRIYDLSTSGKIVPVTANSKSREGQRTTFAVLDETGLWTPSNGGIALAAAIRRNLAKTKGRSIETTNAYVPGEQSVAEATHETVKSILAGRAVDTGVLYDHVEAPASVDTGDRAQLLGALKDLYVEAPWTDVENYILPMFYDLSNDPQDNERFFLNRITHATDSWLSQPDWMACHDPEKTVEPGETITVGFDGSRQRNRGMADATALIGCRVSDGHLFELGVWEQPEGPAGDGWSAPRDEINERVAEVFDDYNVIAFYADPNKWESYVAQWEADYGSKLKVKASQAHPVEFWPNLVTRMVRATDAFHNAVIDRVITHGSDTHEPLTRHVINARRRSSRMGVQISKEHPSSWRKIDAAIAAILAHRARSDALSQGVSAVKRRRPRRLQGYNG